MPSFPRGHHASMCCDPPRALAWQSRFTGVGCSSSCARGGRTADSIALPVVHAAERAIARLPRSRTTATSSSPSRSTSASLGRARRRPHCGQRRRSSSSLGDRRWMAGRCATQRNVALSNELSNDLTVCLDHGDLVPPIDSSCTPEQSFIDPSSGARLPHIHQSHELRRPYSPLGSGGPMRLRRPHERRRSYRRGLRRLHTAIP